VLDDEENQREGGEAAEHPPGASASPVFRGFAGRLVFGMLVLTHNWLLGGSIDFLADVVHGNRAAPHLSVTISPSIACSCRNTSTASGISLPRSPAG
jgi:hypothetical protein